MQYGSFFKFTNFPFVEKKLVKIPKFKIWNASNCSVLVFRRKCVKIEYLNNDHLMLVVHLGEYEVRTLPGSSTLVCPEDFGVTLILENEV